MKSMITKVEEKKYYKRIYFLLPIYVGLVFSVIIFLLYNLVSLVFLGTGFELNWYYILIGFVFGFIEGLSTVYFTLKFNKKKNTYFSNYHKKFKLNVFIPVIFRNGLFNNSKGVLLITKDTIDYKVYQMFEKKTLFFVPYKDAKFTIERQENNWFKKILTLTKYSNILKLITNEKEYEFIVPCLEDVTHRIENYHL
ncbi:hypothetical protein KHQ81_02140 [Mycoplasmatota bacterium]|nr:hypothetical protein KHQ81_02140 [Mycoplasmatota bacterium]